MLHFLLQLPLTELLQQTSTLPELPSGPSLDRIRGPIEIPYLETWHIALIALAGFIALILLGLKLYKRIRSRKNSHVPDSPQDVATAELQSAAKLAASDDERFAVLSSMALRRYFEIGRGIDALGKTTNEFLKSLNNHSLLNDDARQSLTECLCHYDRVKFARATLTQAERQALTQNALELIQRAETTQSVVNQKAHS